MTTGRINQIATRYDRYTKGIYRAIPPTRVLGRAVLKRRDFSVNSFRAGSLVPTLPKVFVRKRGSLSAVRSLPCTPFPGKGCEKSAF